MKFFHAFRTVGNSFPGGTAPRPQGNSTGDAALSRSEILVVFWSLILGTFLSGLDITALSTALPTIVGNLGGLQQLSWVVTAYLLSSTVVVPLYGKMSDLYGRRVVFQFALLLFMAGSALAGTSTTMFMLVAARGLQGFGAGGVQAMTFIIMGDVVSPRERGRYLGFIPAVLAVSALLGPLFGGFFVDHIGWRWIFFINIPLALTTLVVVSRVLLRLPVRRRSHEIDYVGAILLVIAMTSLLLVAVWGGEVHPWSSPIIVSLAAGGLIVGVCFFFQERRTREPILPPGLFRDGVFRVSSGVSFLLGAATFAVMIFVPTFLQVVVGLSATNSGLLTFPLFGGYMITSFLTGRLITRWGRYRFGPVVGTLAAALGSLLLSQLDTDSGAAPAFLGMILIGLGLGMTMHPLLVAVQNSIDHRDLGIATSAVHFFRSVGATLGVAAAGAVFTARLASELARLLPRDLTSQLDPSKLVRSPQAIRQLSPTTAGATIQAISNSLHSVFLLVVPVLALAFLIALRLKELPLRETVYVETSETLVGEAPV